MAGAAHVSCTVEMADTETRCETASPQNRISYQTIDCKVLCCCSYRVGVLDEIQMLADETRGWAWTRALLGLAVDEVLARTVLYLCSPYDLTRWCVGAAALLW